jgi:hypothetical protein
MRDDGCEPCEPTTMMQTVCSQRVQMRELIPIIVKNCEKNYIIQNGKAWIPALRRNDRDR